MARAAATETDARTEAGGDARELILAAALRAFSQRGFDGSTTRDIARDAGVNHGLIRYYFGSKDRLWREAVDRAFAELRSGVDAILNDPHIADDRERAGRMIRGYVRFVGRHPEFVRLMHEEGKRTGPRMRWLVDRHVRPLYAAVSALIERAKTQGLLRLDVPLVHFHYILAGAVGLLFHQSEECRRLTGVDPFDEAVIEEHARVVERLLLGPPADAGGAT